MGSKGSEWNEPSVDKPSQDEAIPRDLCWDGVTKADTKDPEGLHVRNHLASLAKSCSWAEMLDLLAEYPPLVNASRPNGKSRYAPLHQAAYGGAPIEVVDRLLKLGAFRTLRSSSDSRPVDIARNRSHVHLVPILQLDCKRHVPAKVLSKLQANFHEVIRGRVNELVQEKALRLPELDILLEFDHGKFWFPVPGMMGGFSFWLECEGENAKLISESWSRGCGGSGERHEITASGSLLTDQGFV